MNEEILDNQKKYFSAYLNFIYNSGMYKSGIIVYTLLSPLYVMSILKQISIPAHKDIYDDPFIKNI